MGLAGRSCSKAVFQSDFFLLNFDENLGSRREKCEN
jgi:hypothetical protein